ncbi:16S rRNA (guanine(527)-N(7))-methyltransferase RsmG [Paracoccus shanxieyensis]|uniref:Ribosomal RNA small subunit methyltransferase G n=1 Tax=Paracoccus shanxieyensis TaxID=2675752 RepID=A0A6L6J552_9RHOB|nr:16S rRNA (guanine(527)-N(7))-methyltransferase RsmG [Paracoccus shanxieyensis]MTH66370.1 16S rRNA (guanine(527)-N(7))-methyltransferase RsmG [Paracoccus shanxieyensis]MTH89601.1 16S rRNA (guanine(527)-N(7))-methyltransferase RsmG [Paracoccus shanxieyensis]
MTTVSRETMQLEAYATLLRKWNPTINLVAPATLPNLEARHIADSLQLARTAEDAVGDWLDIGSGGGLPGIVIAVSRPDLSVSLLESDKRKCSFLRSAVRELGLENVKIINERIEQAGPQSASNVSARALAPLPLLLSYVSRHLAPDGTAWLMKGRNWRSEVDDARKDWSFDLCTHKSQTDEEAVILQITGIRHA